MEHKKHESTAPAPFAVRLFHVALAVTVAVALGYFVYLGITGKGTHIFKSGLDIAGGTQLTYIADTTNVPEQDVDGLMAVLRDVIERRVNMFGVSEPLVFTEKGSAVSDGPKNRLVVELPGVTNINDAIKQIGATPHLEFKLMNTSSSTVAAYEKYQKGEQLNEAEMRAVASAYIPTGLTGRYVSRAQASFSQSNGPRAEPVVQLTFNEEGAKLFGDITAAHVGEQLAIFLDGNVISAPRINEAIYGGTAVVSGNFTLDGAKELADNLSFGSLPIGISLANTQIVDASLGAHVLTDGAHAGIVGFILVALMMLLWYRASGLASIFGLLAYVTIMLALVLWIPVTLTAAGIAGLILSMGIAIDANVLTFERFKEEYRAGKRAHEAVRIGFSRAWPAIRDGHLTTLFSAVVLYWFGTSFVQGFAFMLGMGILVSLFSALVVSRLFARLFPDTTITAPGVAAWLLKVGIHS